MNLIVKKRLRRARVISPVTKEAAQGMRTDPWLDKTWLSVEENARRKARRDDFEKRFKQWREQQPELAALWETALVTLPGFMLQEEQDRRLALEKKITEIPDELLAFELERRIIQSRNAPEVI